MRVAGFGCRTAITEAQARAALNAALAAAPGPVDGLATWDTKASEPALVALAATLDLPLQAVSADALRAVASHALTQSARSLAAAGVPSIAECAALAATPAPARLEGPRVIVGPVTCALARTGETSP